MLVCAPILLPYIAGTRRTWQEGLKATLIFGITRLIVYSILGGAVGYVGYYLFQLFQNQLWGKILWGSAGLFVIALGILIMIGREWRNPFCELLQKRNLSMVVLGAVIGLFPCLPLLAVLTEIMFISEKFYQGFLYGFAFGVGTVVSPLLLLGALAAYVPGKLLRGEKYFNIFCGALLALFGIYLVASKI